MSVVREITILDDFYGITTTKGDLIVNNGIKNIRFPVGPDGYVLVADSTAATGLRWAPTITSNTNASYVQVSLLTAVATNSTAPISIDEMQFTPPQGNYIIWYDFIYSMSKSDSFLSIGLYKNNILETSSERVLLGIHNYPRQITSQFIASANGSDIFSIKFYVSDNNSFAQILEGNVLALYNVSYSQHTISSAVATNNTAPTSINELQLVPLLGNYVALCSLMTKVTKLYSYTTIGLYKNNVLTADSLSTSQDQIYSVNKISTNGVDIIVPKYNVSALDYYSTVYAGNLIIMKFENVTQFCLSGVFSTNSTSPIAVPDLSINANNGSYIIIFNAVILMQNLNQSCTIGIYKNNALIAGTNRTFKSISGFLTSVQILHALNLNGSEPVEIRINSSTNADIKVFNRQLLVIPL